MSLNGKKSNKMKLGCQLEQFWLRETDGRVYCVLLDSVRHFGHGFPSYHLMGTS